MGAILHIFICSLWLLIMFMFKFVSDNFKTWIICGSFATFFPFLVFHYLAPSPGYFEWNGRPGVWQTVETVTGAIFYKSRYNFLLSCSESVGRSPCSNQWLRWFKSGFWALWGWCLFIMFLLNAALSKCHVPEASNYIFKYFFRFFSFLLCVGVYFPYTGCSSSVFHIYHFLSNCEVVCSLQADAELLTVNNLSPASCLTDRGLHANMAWRYGFSVNSIIAPSP